MNQFRHIIELWDEVADFAADLGVSYTTAHSWKERNSIPARHWKAVVDKARERGKYVSSDMLVNIAAEKRVA